LNSTPAAWRALLESTEELLATATRAGSILAYEGYVNNVAGRIDLMQSVLDIFPTRHLGVVLDPYNYISRALLPVADKICEEFLNAFADRFVFAHLKDVAPLGADGEAAENDRADLIGTPEFCTGVFPQQTYLRFLRSHRPDLAAIFEHLPMDHIPAAIQKFQALTGGPIQKH
jgi:sugar phosphate isomerase/epimerase